MLGGAQSGFGFQIPQVGGGSGLSSLEARILAAEQKNSVLENDLAAMKNNQSFTSSTQNPFGGPPALHLSHLGLELDYRVL
jgi:hypothetical protein